MYTESEDIHQVSTQKFKKVVKDPVIQLGKPLPDEGTCKHYKKSYRWFRFPCCGKAFPCDVCHEEKENHIMVLANRMICGFCCKEQTYSPDKPCIGCDSSLTRIRSSHWEGGKGCRDKIKMSRYVHQTDISLDMKSNLRVTHVFKKFVYGGVGRLVKFNFYGWWVQK